MGTMDLPNKPTGSSSTSLSTLTSASDSPISSAQLLALQNMLGERLRRQPPPTAEEIEGIKDLAMLSGADVGAH